MMNYSRNFFLFDSLVIQWRFVHRMEKQMKNFMKGFNEIVPQRCIQIFDPKEFEVNLFKKSNFRFGFILKMFFFLFILAFIKWSW